ncbi:MAG: hypothetical protein MUO63_09870, partial [Desulfobulbaceae bacterium]|nr:hypothetical protein [Desulfobulbaceae bacterium]
HDLSPNKIVANPSAGIVSLGTSLLIDEVESALRWSVIPFIGTVFKASSPFHKTIIQLVFGFREIILQAVSVYGLV